MESALTQVGYRGSTHMPLRAKLNHWLGRTLFNTDTLSAYVAPFIQAVVPVWSSEQSLAKVLEVRKESDEVFSLRLMPGRKWGGFIAGQFIGLTVERNGAKMTRYFSLSSSPELWLRSGIIELTIRKQEQGLITPWLEKNLASGSKVTITEAQGEFILENFRNPCLFIAGGSGITPFRAMLQSLDSQDQNTNIHLVYYCDGDTHLFQQEWARLQMRNIGVKVTLIDALEEGRICEAHLQDYVPDYLQRDAYICGPAPMITAGREILATQGMAESKINYEFFGAAPISSHADERTPISTGRAVFERSGKVVECDASTDTTLLAMAESAGLSPVTGCRIGVCHQCICQKSSGRVYNTLTGKTSDSGAGEVQLCVSVPVTDVMLSL